MGGDGGGEGELTANFKRSVANMNALGLPNRYKSFLTHNCKGIFCRQLFIPKLNQLPLSCRHIFLMKPHFNILKLKRKWLFGNSRILLVQSIFQIHQVKAKYSLIPCNNFPEQISPKLGIFHHFPFYWIYTGNSLD